MVKYLKLKNKAEVSIIADAIVDYTKKLELEYPALSNHYIDFVKRIFDLRREYSIRNEYDELHLLIMFNVERNLIENNENEMEKLQNV